MTTVESMSWNPTPVIVTDCPPFVEPEFGEMLSAAASAVIDAPTASPDEGR